MGARATYPRPMLVARRSRLHVLSRNRYTYSVRVPLVHGDAATVFEAVLSAMSSQVLCYGLSAVPTAPVQLVHACLLSV